MSMEEKVVAYMHATIDGEGVPVVDRAYNCEIDFLGGDFATGQYPIVIGQGGVDRQLCQIVITAETAERAPTTIHVNDTTKWIQFRDAAGALADSSFNIEIKKLPPLPTP